MYIGIFKAKQVVVLADNTSLSNHNQLSNSSSQGLDALVDADAIFCYQCVRRMNEQAHIVVEIVRHTNVSYLGKYILININKIIIIIIITSTLSSLYTSLILSLLYHHLNAIIIIIINSTLLLSSSSSFSSSLLLLSLFLTSLLSSSYTF